MYFFRRMLNGICDLSDVNSYNTLVEANDFEFYEIKRETKLDNVRQVSAFF